MHLLQEKEQLKKSLLRNNSLWFWQGNASCCKNWWKELTFKNVSTKIQITSSRDEIVYIDFFC